MDDGDLVAVVVTLLLTTRYIAWMDIAILCALAPVFHLGSHVAK